MAGLDLSRWRVAYSGSEPIRQDSLATFADKFRACGFEPQSYFASYGLAEATLFVSGSRRGQGIAALELDAEAFAANRAEPGKGSVLMSCGYPQPGHAVRIVEPQHLQALGDNQVGEIWPVARASPWVTGATPRPVPAPSSRWTARPGCAPVTWASCATVRCLSPGA